MTALQWEMGSYRERLARAWNKNYGQPENQLVAKLLSSCALEDFDTIKSLLGQYIDGKSQKSYLMQMGISEKSLMNSAVILLFKDVIRSDFWPRWRHRYTLCFLVQPKEGQQQI